jgi:hypothetical protein
MTDDRDFIGYGADPPDPQWPSGASIAVNINLNFEGGSGRSVMKGDGVSEGVLNDIGIQVPADQPLPQKAQGIPVYTAAAFAC